MERWEHLAGTLATCRWVPLPPTVRCHCRVPVCVEQQQPDSRPWARSTLSLWSVFTNHPASTGQRCCCFSERVLRSAPAMIRGWERRCKWNSLFLCGQRRQRYCSCVLSDKRTEGNKQTEQEQTEWVSEWEGHEECYRHFLSRLCSALLSKSAELEPLSLCSRGQSQSCSAERQIARSYLEIDRSARDYISAVSQNHFLNLATGHWPYNVQLIVDKD